MANTQRSNLLSSQRILLIAGIILSGLCWYLANGFTGDFWYLMWFAPVPVLIISFKDSARKTFIVSFVAYLIGRLSWFSYLVAVASIVPAIIFTALLPLIFTAIMIITRKTVIKAQAWYAVFVYPVFFTVFELMLISFSPDGTIASIAYSQLNFLPFIQIASVTGILGITFIISFIPSVIAVGWHYRKEKNKFQYIIAAASIILISVFLFGIIRINKNNETSTINVGLTVLDEKSHNITNKPDTQKEKLVTENYINQISSLAANGAELVVLPERAINITKETASDIIEMLSSAAKQNRVCIITGYTNFRNDKERNSALVINAEGKLVTDYNKVHLVKGLEDQFTPGNEIALFNYDGMQTGVAICKDLDFATYIKKYGSKEAFFLAIPSWDFVIDDWLHSRMAVLRGVENGFSEIRTARQGRLTISDYLGRINYEASSSDGNAKSLLGKISLQKRNTIYTRFGNWFEIVILISAIWFILFVLLKKDKPDAITIINPVLK